MQSLKIIGLSVLVKIFKVFTIYGCGGHLGHVTRTIYINFVPLSGQGCSKLAKRFQGRRCLNMVDNDGLRGMGIL